MRVKINNKYDIDRGIWTESWIRFKDKLAIITSDTISYCYYNINFEKYYTKFYNDIGAKERVYFICG